MHTYRIFRHTVVNCPHAACHSSQPAPAAAERYGFAPICVPSTLRRAKWKCGVPLHRPESSYDTHNKHDDDDAPTRGCARDANMCLRWWGRQRALCLSVCVPVGLSVCRCSVCTSRGIVHSVFILCVYHTRAAYRSVLVGIYVLYILYELHLEHSSSSSCCGSRTRTKHLFRVRAGANSSHSMRVA